MTIAISIKVNDGVVLAADSASSLIVQDERGSVVNIYNNANKIFNLVKGLPIGALTWGAGSIGVASISTLAKDLRARFSGDDSDWSLSPESYSIEHIAKMFRRFFFEEHYESEFKDWKIKPDVGFIVAGYSAGSGLAEEYQISIENGECSDPRPLRPKEDPGMTWGGEPDAITRLVLGSAPHLPEILKNDLSVPPDDIPGIMKIIHARSAVQFATAPMPIQDAIDLAEFLVDTTIKFSRFRPGAPTVGGPIEIAAITKHEGFRWVKRKHYFPADLNPQK